MENLSQFHFICRGWLMMNINGAPFPYFNEDGNGYIEAEELHQALMEDGPDDSTDVANDILREVDTDKVINFLCSDPAAFALPYCNLSCNVSFIFSLTRYPWTFLELQDGKISYDEFVAMMKTGTDWRKAYRQYSRGRFNSLSVRLMKDGSLNMGSEN